MSLAQADVTDLVAFLRVRLDEDERAAKAASAGGRWRYEGSDAVGAWTLYDETWAIASLTTYRHSDYDDHERMPAFRHPRYVDADANGEHIARHDPARVLTEVEAKRLLLGDVERDLADDSTDETARWTLRVLALPYADHPDYRPEYRP